MFLSIAVRRPEVLTLRSPITLPTVTSHIQERFISPNFVHPVLILSVHNSRTQILMSILGKMLMCQWAAFDVQIKAPKKLSQPPLVDTTIDCGQLLYHMLYAEWQKLDWCKSTGIKGVFISLTTENKMLAKSTLGVQLYVIKAIGTNEQWSISVHLTLSFICSDCIISILTTRTFK